MDPPPEPPGPDASSVPPSLGPPPDPPLVVPLVAPVDELLVLVPLVELAAVLDPPAPVVAALVLVDPDVAPCPPSSATPPHASSDKAELTHHARISMARRVYHFAGARSMAITKRLRRSHHTVPG
jgi:hypothetical protein